MSILMVMAGGAIGALMRFGVSAFVKTTSLPAFVATGMVNVIGSFFIGMAFVWLVYGRDLPSPWALFILTGILGGFTTFSAFSLELMTLLQNGRVSLAFIYALGSVVLGLLAAFVGFYLASRL